MGSVTQLCSRGIVIQQGSVAFDGDVTEAVERYLGGDSREPVTLGRQNFTGNFLNDVSISSLDVNGLSLTDTAVSNPLEEVLIEFEGESRSTLNDFDLMARDLQKWTKSCYAS